MRNLKPKLAGSAALPIAIASIFAVSMLAHCALFFVLPFLVPLLTGLAVVCVGAIALGITLYYLVKYPSRVHFATGVGVLFLWGVWLFAPTRDLGILVRFHLEKPKYSRDIANLEKGAKLACSVVCMTDAERPEYVVFPWDGFLSAWTGIVYARSDNLTSLVNFTPPFSAGAVCNPVPLDKHFYVCGFY